MLSAPRDQARHTARLPSQSHLDEGDGRGARDQHRLPTTWLTHHAPTSPRSFLEDPARRLRAESAPVTHAKVPGGCPCLSATPVGTLGNEITRRPPHPSPWQTHLVLTDPTSCPAEECSPTSHYPSDSHVALYGCGRWASPAGTWEFSFEYVRVGNKSPGAPAKQRTAKTVVKQREGCAELPG